MGRYYNQRNVLGLAQMLWRDVARKKVIIQSLHNLSERKLIDVFAFTIMPNHIHLIWRTNSLNGKETAQGSF
jgi:putative transposase